MWQWSEKKTKMVKANKNMAKFVVGVKWIVTDVKPHSCDNEVQNKKKHGQDDFFFVDVKPHSCDKWSKKENKNGKSKKKYGEVCG